MIDDDDIANGVLIEAKRDWFVTYDVTGRRIVLQQMGMDEQEITEAEAMLLRAELLAAVAAQREALGVLGEDQNDGD